MAVVRFRGAGPERAETHAGAAGQATVDVCDVGAAPARAAPARTRSRSLRATRSGRASPRPGCRIRAARPSASRHSTNRSDAFSRGHWLGLYNSLPGAFAGTRRPLLQQRDFAADCRLEARPGTVDETAAALLHAPDNPPHRTRTPIRAARAPRRGVGCLDPLRDQGPRLRPRHRHEPVRGRRLRPARLGLPPESSATTTTGTDLGQTSTKTVRVLLQDNRGSISFEGRLQGGREDRRPGHALQGQADLRWNQGDPPGHPSPPRSR